MKKIKFEGNPSSFEHLKEQEYFVDKTMFIQDVIDNPQSSIIITRFRRSGKTMNMSMLNEFFQMNIDKDGKQLPNNPGLFDNTLIYNTDVLDKKAILMLLAETCETKNSNNTQQIFNYLVMEGYLRKNKKYQTTFEEQQSQIASLTKKLRTLFTNNSQDQQISQILSQIDEKGYQPDSEIFRQLDFAVESKIEEWRKSMKEEEQQNYQELLFKFGNSFRHFYKPVTDNEESLHLQLKQDISDTYQRHEYLQKIFQKIIDDPEIGLQNRKEANKNLINFQNFLYKREDDYTSGINFLIKILSQTYSQQVILLIDEYDAPIMFLKIKNILRKKSIKDNSLLKISVITGVARLGELTLFSYLNISEYTIFDKLYSKYFGFTEDEVITLLNKFNKNKSTESQLSLQLIASWYKGYLIGNQTLYNPFSLLKCLSVSQINGKPCYGMYWIESESLYILQQFYLNLKEQNIVLELFTQPIIEFHADKYMTLGYLNSGSENEFLQYMINLGYLTRVKDAIVESYKIPNQEVKDYIFRYIFPNFVENIIGNTTLNIKWQNIGYQIDQIGQFQESLESTLLKSIVKGQMMRERDFQSILYSILYFNPQFGYAPYQEIQNSNRKKLDGLFLPNKSKDIVIIHEYKIAKSNDIQKSIDDALWQVCINHYFEKVLELNSYEENKHWTSILLRAIAFYQNEIQGSWETKVEEYELTMDSAKQILEDFYKNDQDVKVNYEHDNINQMANLDNNNKQNLRNQILFNGKVKSIQQYLQNKSLKSNLQQKQVHRFCVFQKRPTPIFISPLSILNTSTQPIQLESQFKFKFRHRFLKENQTILPYCQFFGKNATNDYAFQFRWKFTQVLLKRFFR